MKKKQILSCLLRMFVRDGGLVCVYMHLLYLYERVCGPNEKEETFPLSIPSNINKKNNKKEKTKKKKKKTKNKKKAKQKKRQHFK
jgi:hypothetical protein